MAEMHVQENLSIYLEWPRAFSGLAPPLVTSIPQGGREDVISCLEKNLTHAPHWMLTSLPGPDIHQYSFLFLSMACCFYTFNKTCIPVHTNFKLKSNNKNKLNMIKDNFYVYLGHHILQDHKHTNNTIHMIKQGKGTERQERMS